MELKIIERNIVLAKGETLVSQKVDAIMTFQITAPLSQAWNPLDFVAADSLTFFSLSFVVSLVVALVAKYLTRASGQLSEHDFQKTVARLSPYEVAYMVDGPKGPVNLALIQMQRDNQIQVQTVSGVIQSDPSQLVESDPLKRSIHGLVSSGEGCSILEIRKGLSSEVVILSNRLRSQKMLESFGSFLIPRLALLCVMLPVFSLVISKMFIGSSRGKPIGFLIFMTLIAAALTLWMMQLPRLTRLGQRVLAYLRTTMHKKQFAIADLDTANPGEFSLGTALFGITAIAGISQLGPINDLLRSDKTYAYSDTSYFMNSGSDGDAGGGGCGGGGGGCGGCGD